ncbi:hypothetical protein D3C80_1754830 [compost metagenome]
MQSISGYSGLRPGSLIFCVNFSPSSHGLASSPNMVMTITFGAMGEASLAKAGALASREAAEAARVSVRTDRFMDEASLSDRMGRGCFAKPVLSRSAILALSFLSEGIDLVPPLAQSFACRHRNRNRKI